MVLKH